jgi:beta-ketodecanoyl-[acyl-carrier-protein] synthase
MCEMAVEAAREALAGAALDAGDLDAVICAASNMQRAYPAMAVEIQDALGAGGYAFDMNVACSSATFGLQQARDAIVRGQRPHVLVVNPEICTGHLNFRDRDSHFIFGDVCTAMVISDNRGNGSGRRVPRRRQPPEDLFSNNIRNNFGFLNRADERGIGAARQALRAGGSQGVQGGVSGRGGADQRPAGGPGHAPGVPEAPVAAPGQPEHEPAHRASRPRPRPERRRGAGNPRSLRNTSSAGSVIAFHKHHDDFEPGERGVLCSFGAGYSIGSVILERC